MLSVTLSCVTSPTGKPPHPPPEVYEQPINFSGSWRGEVAGVAGTLSVERLSDGRYYANFRARSLPERFILSMEQETAEVTVGEHELANLSKFTWQDGRGSRGRGWLLINREDTAITGSFGRGTSVSGMGMWTFVREDER